MESNNKVINNTQNNALINSNNNNNSNNRGNNSNNINTNNQQLIPQKQLLPQLPPYSHQPVLILYYFLLQFILQNLNPNTIAVSMPNQIYTRISPNNQGFLS